MPQFIALFVSCNEWAFAARAKLSIPTDSYSDSEMQVPRLQVTPQSH